MAKKRYEKNPYAYAVVNALCCFARDYADAKAAGRLIGVYYYSTDSNIEELHEHTDELLAVLEDKELDLPVAFDWEDFDHFQKYGMSIHDLNHLFDVFYDELSKYGYYAMLYSSRNFLYNFWENKNNRTVWLAHFIDETDYTGEYAIWQTTADCIVPGIDRIVDVDIQYMDRPLYK